MLTRNKKIIILLSIVLTLFVLLFTSACSQNITSTTNENKDYVCVALPKSSQPTKGFDPIYGWGCGEHVNEPLIQSTLIKTNSDLGIEMDLATSYTISQDAKSITFNIRDDAYFSDGTKLSANDVAFTINKLIDNIDNPTDFSSIKSAHATADLTCEVNLNNPDSTILYLLSSVGIVPANSYNSEDYGRNPIGSGRYKLQSWEPEKSATLVANEDYYGQTPNIKTIKVLFVEESASCSCAKTGEADVSYTSCVLANSKIEGYTLQSLQTQDSRGISLPTNPNEGNSVTKCNKTYECGNNITCDFSVRLAINLAIDRERLINDCLYGYGHVAYSVCDGLPWATDEVKIEQDKEKAIKTLEDAGWNLLSGKVREKDGVQLEFNLYYPINDTTRQSLAYAFCDQLSEIGIKVNAISASWDDIYPHQYTDAVLWGWGTNTPSEVISIIKSDGACNFPKYSLLEADNLISQALASRNLYDAFKNLKKAQELTSPASASSWVWLVNVDHTYFVKNSLNIGNQKLQSHGHGWSLLNNVDEWSWT